MTHPRLIVAASLASALGLAACGSSDSSSTSTPAPAPAASTPAAATTAAPAAAAPAATGGALTVAGTEYAFKPATLSAPAGKVKITFANEGKIPHELVLLKTASAPDALKVDAKTSRVSESDSVGEISETDAGKSGSHTFDLKPGTYVYVCNIPAHYKLGMHGLLTVK